MTVFFQKPIKAKQATVRVCKVFDKGNTVISTTTSTLGEVMLGK